MFYRLKIKADAKRVPAEVLGFPVNKEVSTYVETTRDSAAEADKKGLKVVEVTAVETLPERGENGDAPYVIRLGDHGQNTAAPEADEPEAPSEPETPTEDPVDTTDPADGDDEDTSDATDDELPKKQYKVLPGELGGGVEYPRGTVHEPGSILELTDEEASLFADGLIEPVETEPADDGGDNSDEEEK